MEASIVKLGKDKRQQRSFNSRRRARDDGGRHMVKQKMFDAKQHMVNQKCLT